MKSGNPIKSDKIILLVAGLTFAVITIVTIATEETPGWKYYQSEFKYEVVDAGQATMYHAFSNPLLKNGMKN